MIYSMKQKNIYNIKGEKKTFFWNEKNRKLE